MMPRAGGEYVYLKRAFHPAAGFLAGWISFLVGFAAPTAGGALAFGRYLHAADPAIPPVPASVALVVVLTAAHMTHVRFGARLQTAITGMVLALIATFILGAVVSGHGDVRHLIETAPVVNAGVTVASPVTAGAFAVGLVYVGYAYCGWNSVAYMAGDRVLYVGTLQLSKSMFTADGVMPADGPATVLKVLGTFNPAVKGKESSIDLSKTFTTKFVDAAK